MRGITVANLNEVVRDSNLVNKALKGRGVGPVDVGGESAFFGQRNASAEL